jgi:hypothetical protein
MAEKHGKKIKEKLYAVLERNCGWQSLLKLSAALECEATEFPNGWSMEDALAAKYTPATSAEVERTFSKLKYLLSDRRLTMMVKLCLCISLFTTIIKTIDFIEI